MIHDEKNVKRIDSIWAYLSEDETGDGLVAYPCGPGGSLMPLIAADEERLASLRPIADYVAKFSKKRIKLVRFSNMETLEVFGGGQFADL